MPSRSSLRARRRPRLLPRTRRSTLRLPRRTASSPTSPCPAASHPRPLSTGSLLGRARSGSPPSSASVAPRRARTSPLPPRLSASLTPQPPPTVDLQLVSAVLALALVLLAHLPTVPSTLTARPLPSAPTALSPLARRLLADTRTLPPPREIPIV